MPQLPKDSSILCFLLDIEGTTTPVDFVYKTLFPFSSERVEIYLREHVTEPEVVSVVGELRNAHAQDEARHPALGPWPRGSAEEQIACAVKYVRHLIAVDRKLTPLKTLQGRIWEDGFLSGALHGEVYEDVPRAFERWSTAGKRIAIFSSGSVLAQKLLFAHSTAGDLTRFISGYFDTTTGPKREMASYTTIATALGAPSSNMLFVSDVAAELDAAKEAAMHTALITRPGANRPEGSLHACIESLDELFGAT